VAKTQSDVFICKLGGEDYWAYPSPFVAHGVGAKIQFRNLTDDEIEIDFGKAPLDKKTLPLKAKGAGLITVKDKARADLYEYEAVVMVPAAVPAIGAGGKPLAAVRVKGGSSPKIIIDT
jgi:hypothetical protein